MYDTTVCFLLEGAPPARVLLGYKKRGFGAGKYAGIGGKVESGEQIAVAAAREVAEEIGVKVAIEDLQSMGVVRFVFPAQPAWDQTVHIFTTTRWSGTPAESDEMRPRWFPVNQLPFDLMWSDTPIWMPPVLAGVQIAMRFTFAADNETVESYKHDRF